MSFVGKVLVVTNVFLAVCLMVFAGAVSTVQVNWKSKVAGLEEQVATLQGQYADAEAKATLADEQKKRDVTAALADASRAQGKLGALQDKYDELDGKYETLESQMLKYQVSSNLADTESEIRRSEANVLREVNQKLHDARDALFQERSKLQQENYAQARKIEDLNAVYQENLVQLADIQKYISLNGLTLEDLKERGQKPVPLFDVDGKIEIVRVQESTGKIRVQINIGSDDTIRKGHQLYVLRNKGRGAYLGKIEIVDVSPDQAVGVVTEQVPNTKILEGDDVTTKI